MQSPEQVSDFDGDAWFLRSRRLKFVTLSYEHQRENIYELMSVI